jgi:uncharacterized protein (DUF433 family)
VSKSTRRFKHFPLILIDPKRAWANPTLKATRIPVFKIWEMVNNKCMDAFLEENPTLTLGEINSVLQFVEWCINLGLMEVNQYGDRLRYDKDALYAAAKLECPPKGSLCLYCVGFIPSSSPVATFVRDSLGGSGEPREGIAHNDCIQAIVLGEVAPLANILQ